MCMFRFPDPDFERSFYRDLFGVDPHDAEPGRDLEWLERLASGTSQDLGVQTSRETVTTGVLDS